MREMGKRKKIILLLASLVFVMIAAGIYSQVARDSMTQLEAVAEREARRTFLISRFPLALVPYHVDITDISDRISDLKGYRLYHVRGYVLGVHPPMASANIAIAPDGKTFDLPRDFNKLITHRGIQIQDKYIALNVAKLYVEFLGYKLVSNISEIPHKYRDLPNGLNDLDLGTKVRQDGDYFTIILTTWKLLGGKLERWKFQIKQSKVEINRELLEEEIGDYGMMQ